MLKFIIYFKNFSTFFFLKKKKLSNKPPPPHKSEAIAFISLALIGSVRANHASSIPCIKNRQSI